MRTMSARVTCLIGLCGLAFMTGCGPTTYRMPGVGEQDVTATLEIKHGFISAYTVDGRRPHPPLTAKKFLTYGLGGHLVNTARINKVEILPGDHELDLCFSKPLGANSFLASKAPRVVQFTAQAGRIYRVNGLYTIPVKSGEGYRVVTHWADDSPHSSSRQYAKAYQWLGFVEDITGPLPRIVSPELFNSKTAELTTSDSPPPGAVSPGGGN